MPALTHKNAPEYADRVNLIKKIKVGSAWRFAPVVPEANGRLKDKVRVNGQIEVHVEGAYYIEWRERGKRCRVSVTREDAIGQARRKAVELRAVREGLIAAGLTAMAERNRAKAGLLYRTIDESPFYRNPVAPDCRSWMNVPFTLANPALDAAFLAEARAAGLVNLEGHRSGGGMRASLYNAMPLEGVTALSEFMRQFERRQA